MYHSKWRVFSACRLPICTTSSVPCAATRRSAIGQISCLSKGLLVYVACAYALICAYCSCLTASAQYTCPSCNVPYCSLACFRRPEHTTCSQPFAQRSAHANLDAADVSVADEERQRTLELLWRLESGEGVVEDNVAPPLEPTDVEHHTADELMQMLTPAERERFAELLRNPQRAAHLAAEAPPTLPWWCDGDAARPWHTEEPEYTQFLEQAQATFSAPGAPNLLYNMLLLLCVGWKPLTQHGVCVCIASLGRAQLG